MLAIKIVQRVATSEEKEVVEYSSRRHMCFIEFLSFCFKYNL